MSYVKVDFGMLKGFGCPQLLHKIVITEFTCGLSKNVLQRKQLILIKCIVFSNVLPFQIIVAL